jgi:hypothetical protein
LRHRKKPKTFTSEEPPMIELEIHKARHADLVRAGAAERLARQALRARKEAAGTEEHGSGRRVRPLQHLFDHAA